MFDDFASSSSSSSRVEFMQTHRDLKMGFLLQVFRMGTFCLPRDVCQGEFSTVESERKQHKETAHLNLLQSVFECVKCVRQFRFESKELPDMAFEVGICAADALYNPRLSP